MKTPFRPGQSQSKTTFIMVWFWWWLLASFCRVGHVDAFLSPTKPTTTIGSSHPTTTKVTTTRSTPFYLARRHGSSFSTTTVVFATTDAANMSSSGGTLRTLTTKSLSSSSKPTTITLIGTAHLSEKSNQQVQSVIESIQPNVVMIELDPTRLSRIGIDDIKDIKIPNVVASGSEIEVPGVTDNRNNNSNNNFLNVLVEPFRKALFDGISNTIGKWMKEMYNDLSKEMKNEKGGGAEFLVAIRAAEACSNTQTLVLGDRPSVTTIRRTLELAWKSGNPWGVLSRLEEANAKEMQELEERVKKDLQTTDEQEIDPAQLKIAVMETLKEDNQFRERMFQKLEQEVPEFTQAFLKERDYIMSESIRREIVKANVENVVAVVGLAHVPGMTEQLKSMLDLEEE